MVRIGDDNRLVQRSAQARAPGNRALLVLLKPFGEVLRMAAMAARLAPREPVLHLLLLDHVLWCVLGLG